MAQYYFHIIDGQFWPDREGTECKDLNEVKAQAVRAAGAMLQEQGGQLWRTGHWDMYVTAEQNRTRLKLSFRADDLRQGD